MTERIIVEVNSVSGAFTILTFDTLTEAERFCLALVNRSNTLKAFIKK